jgi:hypothetical protein
MGESGAELIAPATDRFIRDHDTTLEQQLLDVAQAQAEPEIPPNGAADDDGREAVTVIKRFRFLFITSFYRRLPINLTVPLERFDLRFPGFTHDTHGVEI